MYGECMVNVWWKTIVWQILTLGWHVLRIVSSNQSVNFHRMILTPSKLGVLSPSMAKTSERSEPLEGSTPEAPASKFSEIGQKNSGWTKHLEGLLLKSISIYNRSISDTSSCLISLRTAAALMVSIWCNLIKRDCFSIFYRMQYNEWWATMSTTDNNNH